MVTSSFDQIFETAGEGDFDTVDAGVSYAQGANVEKRSCNGLPGYRRCLSNTITGEGIDGLIGGKGNDFYTIVRSDR